MLSTKNLLMVVVLSAGLLTSLTGIAISQVQPVFASDDEDECNDNRDNNCNEDIQKIHQENNCKVDGKNKNGDKSDENTQANSIDGKVICTNIGQNAENDANSNIQDVFDPFA